MEIEIQWFPVFALFRGFMKNGVNCMKEQITGNERIIT
jgi:hypothetical protein